MELPSINELSLWLEPSGKDYEKIASFNSKLQGQCGCPNFAPHVTLLANIPLSSQDIESGMEKLKTYKSFRIQFKKLSYGENPLKSFFLECEELPELMKLNKLAQGVYSMNTFYLPHMSFIYGIVDEKMRKRLIKEVENINIDFFSYDVRKISLWHALGPVEEWKKIAEIDLM